MLIVMHYFGGALIKRIESCASSGEQGSGEQGLAPSPVGHAEKQPLDKLSVRSQKPDLEPPPIPLLTSSRKPSTSIELSVTLLHRWVSRRDAACPHKYLIPRF